MIHSNVGEKNCFIHCRTGGFHDLVNMFICRAVSRKMQVLG